jgi:hypothetical protein
MTKSPEQIREALRHRYAKVAEKPKGSSLIQSGGKVRSDSTTGAISWTWFRQPCWSALLA